MAKLVFIGSHMEIEGEHSIVLERFGQAFEVSDPSLSTTLLASGAVISAAEFAACGFTADELCDFGEVWKHSAAPPDFLSKKSKAAIIAQGARRKAREAETQRLKVQDSSLPVLRAVAEDSQQKDGGGN